MKFPVDLLASVDPGALELSAKDCMSKLLYRSPEIQESLRLPDSKEIAIDLCNVSFMPLYGYDTEHRILELYSREDIHTAVGLHLLGKWWSFEDILKTADPSRTGLLEVRTPVERIVLHVLNKFIYKAMEKASDEDPFLCHREYQIAKILWKDGEAIGFYSFIPEGTLCDSFVTQCYQLPVMDTIFVRKLHRGKGYGLQMLEDFVHTFRNESVGLKYPLPAAMYEVCRSYLSTYPADKQLLWEIHDVGAPYQRTLISKKLQTVELKGHHQFVHKLNFETENTGVLMENVISTPAQKTGVEYTVMEEEDVQFKRIKEVNDTPVTTLGRSGNLKRKMLGKETEATTEKTIRMEVIEAAVQSPVHEAETVGSARNLKETTTTVNRGESKVVCVTCVHCGKHIEQTTESEEYVREVSDLPNPTAELATLTMEKTASLQMTSNVAEFQSINSSEETQIIESVEGTTGAVELQALEVQQLVEVEIGKLTSEKAMEKTELLQMTSNISEKQSIKSSGEAQVGKPLESAIGAADLQALEVNQLVEVVIDKELTSGTEVIKERMENAGGVKDGEDEGDDKISEKVICEVSSLQKSGQQTGLDLQPVTMGSENSSNTKIRILRKSTTASQQKSTYLHEELQVASKPCPTKATKTVTKHKSVQRSLKAVLQDEIGQTVDITAHEVDQQLRSEVQMEEKLKDASEVLQEKDVQSQDTDLQDENIEIYGEKMIVEIVGISQVGAEVQKEIDCEMNLLEKGEESSVVSSVAPASEVEQHITQELLQPEHEAIAEETEESRNENMEIDQCGVAKSESSVNVGMSMMENTEQTQEQEHLEDANIIQESKYEEIKEMIKRRENNEEFKSDCTEPIEEKDSDKADRSHSRTKHDEPLTETQSHQELQEIPGQLERDAIEDTSEPSHVHVGKESDNRTESIEQEGSDKPGTSEKHDGNGRSIYSTPVRRSGRFKDQSVEGELTKIVLRSGTKLTTPISIQKQVRHTNIVKQQESKGTEKDFKEVEERSEKETREIRDGGASKDEDQGRVVGSADTNQGIMEVTQEMEPLKETQTIEEIQGGQLTGRVLRSGTKSVTAIEKQVQHTKTVSQKEKVNITNVEYSTNLQDTVEEGNKLEEEHLETESTAEKDIQDVEDGSENKTMGDVMKIDAVDLGVVEVTNDCEIQVERKTALQSDVELIEEQEKEPAAELAENVIAKEKTVQSQEDQDHDLAKLASTEKDTEGSKDDEAEELKQTEALIKLCEKDGNVEAEIIHTVEEQELNKVNITEEIDVLPTESLVELAEKEQKYGNDDISPEIMHTEEEDHLNKATISEEMDVHATEEKTERKESHETSAKTMQLEEEHHLNKAIGGEEVDAFADMATKEPMVQTLEKQVEEVGAENLTRTDSGQEEIMSVEGEVKDDTVEHITLEEQSTAAELHTTERATKEVQESHTSNNEVTVQKISSEESTPFITSRSLRQRTVTVQGSPQRKSKRVHKSEHVENRTEETEENKSEKMETEDGTKTKNQDQGRVPGSTDTDQVLMEVMQKQESLNKTQIVQEVRGQESSHVYLGEKSDIWAESTEEQVSDKPGTSVKQSRSRKSKYSTPVRRSGRFKDQYAEGELTKIVLRSGTKLTTTISKHRQGRHTKPVKQQEKKHVQSEDEAEVKQMVNVMESHTGPVEASDPQDSVVQHSELEKECLGLETTSDSYLKEVGIRIEDDSQDEPTGDSITVGDVDELGKDIEQEGEGETSESLMEPVEKVGGNETYADIIQPQQEEEEKVNKANIAEKEDAFTEIGVEEPITEGLTEQATESCADTLTKDSAKAPEEQLVYTREDEEVLELDHGETVQENVPEEVTPVVTSRSLRHRTVMVTSTLQRSKSKHLQKTEVAWVTEKNKDSTAETDQSKDEKMEAEVSSRSNDEDKASGGQMSVSYTLQEIPTSESSQADETAASDTYFAEAVKDAGHTAQEELLSELVEEHHLEPVTKVALGEGEQKDTEIAEEVVGAAAPPSKLQEASVVLVDFNKASSKQSAEISETSKENDSVPHKEVIQEPDEPASTSRHVDEKTFNEDMLKQADLCVVQAENKQVDEEEVVEIAENENVAMDDATNKLSKEENSAEKVDSNDEKMETEEVQVKDLESVISIVQEIQGDTQEPRQVAEQEKLGTGTELVEVEHSRKRGKAHSTRKTTERSEVVTPVRHSEQLTDQTTTSELTIRVLRSSTKQVQSTPNEQSVDQHTTSELTERVLRSSVKEVHSTPNERSTRQTKELVQKGMAEEEDKDKRTEVPTEPPIKDTIEPVSVLIESTAVPQDIELSVEDFHSGDDTMEELSIRAELFPEEEKDTEVLEETKKATTGTDSEKDIGTDQELRGHTQNPGQVSEEEESATQIELVEVKHSRKTGKAYSIRKTTNQSALGTPVRHSEQLTDPPTTSELSQRVLRSCTKQVQSTPNQQSKKQTKAMVLITETVQAVDRAEEEDQEKPAEVPTELAKKDKIDTVSITTIRHREEDSHPGDEEIEATSIRTEQFLEQNREDEVTTEDVALKKATEATAEEEIEKISDLHDTHIEINYEVENRTPVESMAEIGKEREEAPVSASTESTSVFTVQKATVVLVDFKKVTPKHTSGIQATEESQKGDEQEQGSRTEDSTKAMLELEEQHDLNKADALEEQQKLVEIMVEKSITETSEQSSVKVGEDTIRNTGSGPSEQEKGMLVQEKLTEEVILEEESSEKEAVSMVEVCTVTTEASQKVNQESSTPDHRGNILENSPEEETPIILSRSLRKRIVTVSSSPQRKTKRLSKHGVDNVELGKTVDNVNVVEKAMMEAEMPEETVKKDKEVGNKAFISEEILLEIPEKESGGQKETEAMTSEASIIVEVEATTSTKEHQVSVVKTIEVDEGHEYTKNKDGGLMEGSNVQDLEEEKDLDKIPSGDNTSPTNVVTETTSLTKERIQKEMVVSEKKNTQKTKRFSQKKSTEYHVIKPPQEESYEESSDEDELIITKNLRQRFVIVQSPMRRKSKRHNIVETHTETAQPVAEETALFVEVSSQREASTSEGIQITETPTNSKDSSEDQAQSKREVMSKEVTTLEKQVIKNVTVTVVGTEETQNIGSIGMVEGAPEDNMEERTTEHTISEKVEVKDLTDTSLQENVPDATLEQENGQQTLQEQDVLNKAEELLIEKNSEVVSRRRVVDEEEQGKQLTEKECIGNVSTTEEVFQEFEEGAGDGRRLLRKRTITTTKKTKVTTEGKSKRMCKQSDVEYAGSALSVEEQATDQRIIELTAEKEKEKETTGQTEQKTVEDNDSDGGVLSEKTKDRENPEEEETCGETNISTSVGKEITRVISFSVEELSTKIEIKKGEKGEEKDGVTIIETVEEIKELNEKNPVDYSEITLAPDERFILQLEEEDENNGPKETSVIEKMEVSLMGSSNLGSPSIQTKDKCEEHITQETDVEKAGKGATVKSKRFPKGRSSGTASLQQISPRQSKQFLQESELEDKSETIKEKAEKDVTEEQSPLKRKAIADTPRRSKRLATPKSV